MLCLTTTLVLMLVLVLVQILVLVQVLVAVAVTVAVAVAIAAAVTAAVAAAAVVVVVVVLDDCGDTYEGLWLDLAGFPFRAPSAELPRIANTRPQFLPPTTTLRNWQSSYWQWSS